MRRRAMIAGVAALGTAVMLGLYRFTDIFVKHYPPTPYDDLLTRLVDREQAIKLGAKAPASFDLAARVRLLRSRLATTSLQEAIQQDIASGRLVEVTGWLLPETLVWLSSVAAKT